MSELTVRDILRQWLEANGYGGLYDDNECGCAVDNLIPCDGPCYPCHPGYKGPSPGPELDTQSLQPLPFWIYGTKEAVAEAETDKREVDDA